MFSSTTHVPHHMVPSGYLTLSGLVYLLRQLMQAHLYSHRWCTSNVFSVHYRLIVLLRFNIPITMTYRCVYNGRTQVSRYNCLLLDVLHHSGAFCLLCRF